MSKHALELFRGQQAQDAFRDGDYAVFGVAARGEGVGGFFGNHGDARHGDLGVGGQLAHHAVDHGGFAFRQFAGLIHPQDDFVGIPIAPHVHDQGEAESDNDPRLAAQSASENDDEAGKQGKQHECLQLAGHVRILLWCCDRSRIGCRSGSFPCNRGKYRVGDAVWQGRAGFPCAGVLRYAADGRDGPLPETGASGGRTCQKNGKPRPCSGWIWAERIPTPCCCAAERCSRPSKFPPTIRICWFPHERPCTRCSSRERRFRRT